MPVVDERPAPVADDTRERGHAHHGEAEDKEARKEGAAGEAADIVVAKTAQTGSMNQ